MREGGMTSCQKCLAPLNSTALADDKADHCEMAWQQYSAKMDSFISVTNSMKIQSNTSSGGEGATDCLVGNCHPHPAPRSVTTASRVAPSSRSFQRELLLE
jgi:hypothetical protein